MAWTMGKGGRFGTRSGHFPFSWLIRKIDFESRCYAESCRTLSVHVPDTWLIRKFDLNPDAMCKVAGHPPFIFLSLNSCMADLNASSAGAEHLFWSPKSLTRGSDARYASQNAIRVQILESVS